VGLGACTAVGANVAASAAAVRAGISTFAEHSFVIDTAGNPMIVAPASYLSQDILGADRYIHLSVPAITEAVHPLFAAQAAVAPMAAIIGLPPKRPGLSKGLVSRISEALKSATQNYIHITEIETIQTGHSAGLMALEAGWKKLKRGMAEFCLIGGVDSYLEPATLEWLEACDQLHSAGDMNNAWGFVPGEAAGFCVLATRNAVSKCNVRPLSGIITVATAQEYNLIKTDTVCLGRGLTHVFEQALQALPASSPKIDDIICDMNGEPYRAEEFGFASIRVSEFFTDVSDFIAPADCWGDVGAASGPLFINLASTAWRKGYANGPYALLWTSSESGERCAAVLTDADMARQN